MDHGQERELLPELENPRDLDSGRSDIGNAGMRTRAYAFLIRTF